MSDRRALIIGSWLAMGRDRPSHQKVLAIMKRWSKVFKDNQYGFRSVQNRRRKPEIIQHPERSLLTNIFERAGKITQDTELLIYFLGHSTALGENDLSLILRLNEQGEDIKCSLQWLLSTIREAANIRKLVLILDTCHAGRTEEILRISDFDYYAMFATGSAYAFDARFSEGILKALEMPLIKKDQRIDRVSGGMTYRKVFEFARNYVIKNATGDGISQKPTSCGEYLSDLLLEAPLVVPKDYSVYASDRTIYGRLFRLLELIKTGGDLDFLKLKDVLREEQIFLLRRDGARGDQFVSSERLREYLDFLRKAEWVIQPAGRYMLTPNGIKVCNRVNWNRQLLDVIEKKIFPDELTMELLEKIVSELLSDMIPATPIRIKERAGMKGIPVHLDSATRIALQVLPTTGRFMKGAADAIFPSERGMP